MKKIVTRFFGFYLNVLGYLAPRAAGRKGFLVFCRPLRSPMRKKQTDFLNTAERSIREWEGHRIQVFRWGSGPRTVLLLHGWQSHTYRWKAYVESISQTDYTIYSIDAPGHGLSPGNFLSVPLYSSVIASIIREIGPVHAVAAHSLGGFSLLHALHSNASLPVDNVILMASPGEAGDFIASFRDTLGLSERTTGLVIDHFRSMYGVSPEYFSARAFADGLRVRGLIIHDEQDDEAPYDQVRPVHDAWKNSKLITTSGLGHNLRSPLVVRHVLDFLESVPEEASV